MLFRSQCRVSCVRQETLSSCDRHPSAVDLERSALHDGVGIRNQFAQQICADPAAARAGRRSLGHVLSRQAMDQIHLVAVFRAEGIERVPENHIVPRLVGIDEGMAELRDELNRVLQHRPVRHAAGTGDHMFTRDNVPFCRVCQRAISRVIDLYTR